jgi:hypothetical protein
MRLTLDLILIAIPNQMISPIEVAPNQLYLLQVEGSAISYRSSSNPRLNIILALGGENRHGFLSLAFLLLHLLKDSSNKELKINGTFES